MSNLDKLLRKLAGSSEDNAEPVEAAPSGCIDPVYVEKLASAVEYLLGTDLLAKEANLGKVKALMAQGMSAEEAIKKAYPDLSDEQVAAIAQKLSGGGKEEKEEAEKAASIASNKLRSLLAERRSHTKTASEPQSTEQAPKEFDFSDKVRSALKEKIAAGVGSKAEGDFEFINSVLEKLQTLAASSEKREEAQESTTAGSAEKGADTVSKEASAVDEVDDKVEEAGTATEETAKSANKLNLAEMLKTATSEKAASESVSDTNTETANEHQSNSLTDMLRNSILRKASTQVEV